MAPHAPEIQWPVVLAFRATCVCVCVCVRVRACVRACVCHNEKVPEEWQARQGVPMILPPSPGDAGLLPPSKGDARLYPPS